MKNSFNVMLAYTRV